MFRDGVGDGRLEYTKSTEIPQLESAFRVFGDDYNPKLTVVIVSKRINEKFMHYNSRVRTYNNALLNLFVSSVIYYFILPGL